MFEEPMDKENEASEGSDVYSEDSSEESKINFLRTNLFNDETGRANEVGWKLYDIASHYLNMMEAEQLRVTEGD